MKEIKTISALLKQCNHIAHTTRVKELRGYDRLTHEEYRAVCAVITVMQNELSEIPSSVFKKLNIKL